MRRPGSHNISVADAHTASEHGAVLIDVRTSQERASDGAPAGARHIPLESLSEKMASLHGSEVLVICRSGRRSAGAAAALRRRGVDARNVKGGLLAWKRNGLPLQGTRADRRSKR
jgi:rhodanese-related sulfurtransferase